MENLFKELYETVRNHQPSEEQEKMFRDDMEKLTFITGRVEVVNQIIDFAKKHNIDFRG